MHRLECLVLQHGIPPLPSPGLAWLSSAQPATKPTDQRSHTSTAAPRNELSLWYTKLCLWVCLGRVGNSHTEKRQRQKIPRKINCRQYLIDTMSGAGTIIQATHRGGRKALALGVAHYFHWYWLNFPTSGHHCSWRGCLWKGHEDIFPSAALPTLSLWQDSTDTPMPLLWCCWGRLRTMLQTHPCSQSLPKGLVQQPRPQLLAPAPVE